MANPIIYTPPAQWGEIPGLPQGVKIGGYIKNPLLNSHEDIERARMVAGMAITLGLDKDELSNFCFNLSVKWKVPVLIPLVIQYYEDIITVAFNATQQRRKDK